MAGMLDTLLWAQTGPPAPTGTLTHAGRPVWQAPQGQQYSERTVTIPLPSGVWINAPSVFEGGRIVPSEDDLREIYAQNGGVDPLTGRKLPRYKTVHEAVRAARARSKGL